ncbi:PaaI family thioesterase [Haloarcula salina]|uniref:PaaI family thioesterase n=1 Tax=Haloarcula salina TaxID=1429914 RepID=A0AA41G0J9_9EURY|nr:PaaI family thioesterase [Haloarcula salina]MBV0902192.1 PaaI family thioesterase [Haloarcula salina]
MGLQTLFNDIPFVERLGMEITTVDDGHAAGTLSLERSHSSNPESLVAHGGVTYSLVDTVGGAAVVSLSGSISPTVDMRIDYLAPATADLRAEAEVVRNGGSVAVVDVEVYDDDGHHVASARGTYKTGGDGDGSPWTEGVDQAAIERLEND